MTVTRKQAPKAIAVVLVLFIAILLSASGFARGFGFTELMVSSLALLPVLLIGGLIWFGFEVLSSLRRIEAAVHDDSVEPEFTYGS